MRGSVNRTVRVDIAFDVLRILFAFVTAKEQRSEIRNRKVATLFCEYEVGIGLSVLLGRRRISRFIALCGLWFLDLRTQHALAVGGSGGDHFLFFYDLDLRAWSWLASLAIDCVDQHLAVTRGLIEHRQIGDHYDGVRAQVIGYRLNQINAGTALA